MRAIEEAAMASGAAKGIDLMERAGASVVEAVFEKWPAFSTGAHRAVVLCGPGNNGGDGFVIARLLRAAGWQVDVFLWGGAAKLPPDARANFERFADVQPLPEAIEAFKDAASHFPDLRRDPANEALPPFLVVDALFGIGLKRPLPDIEGLAWHWDYLTNFPDLNASRIVAVDVPSGLDADTGEVVGGATPTNILAAHLTVTFHRPKPAHLTDAGRRFCGDVVVKDIGL
ncbi:MAG: NAD(P)H-hydrate epimerase [Pseudomonadota bacterium]